MERPSLERQLASIMHCIVHAGQHGVSDTVREAAEYGVESFQFLVRYQKEFKALVRTLQAFPDAEIIEGHDND